MKTDTTLATDDGASKEKEPLASRRKQLPMKQVDTLPKGLTLSEYVRDRIESLPKSQRDVAQYIVDHIDDTAFQTAEELARRVSTSSSTVVRFSQNIGFEGFPELQQAAREEYRLTTSKNPNGNGDPGIFSLDKSEFEASLASDFVNVEDTAGRASRQDVEAIAQAVVRADRALVIAFDQLAYFGGYLRYLLGLLDVSAELVANPSQDALTKIGRIDGRTLVFGLVAGRPDPLLVRALKLARHRRGVSVLVADASLTNAAKYANISFYYSSNGPSYVRSHTALVSFIQALAYAVYAQDRDAFGDRIKALKLK